MAIDPTVATVLITTLGTVAGTFILQLMSMIREGKQHKWQREQAEWDRSERIKAATVLGDKIDTNTEISVKAFDVANNVNEKLVAIGQARISHDDENNPGRRDTNGTHPVGASKK